MADYDIYNDKLPRRVNNADRKPTIAQLKAALTAGDATTFTAARMHAMTEIDLINACRVRGYTVNTTL